MRRKDDARELERRALELEAREDDADELRDEADRVAAHGGPCPFPSAAAVDLARRRLGHPS